MDVVTKGRATILAVDDNKTVQVALRRMLLPEGYNVVIADCGEDALDVLRRQEVDVVVLDLLMPGLSGRQVLQVMRSDPYLRAIPVLMATSVTDRKELVSCLDAGADDFVTKPWDEREFLGRMRVLVRLKRALDAVRKERDLATRATFAKSEILSGISHKLRGPLNTLLGFTRKLMGRISDKLDPRDLDALESIDRSGRRLLTLILDIVDVAKIESGDTSLVCSRVDLGDLIITAVNHSKRQIAGKPVNIEVRLPDEFIAIECDQIKVDRIVNKLVSNAIQFTDDGVIEVSLSKVKDQNLGPAARISVKDTGIGIAKEDQLCLFARFAERVGDKHFYSGGGGLGLPISVEFVHMHGGTIQVESELGMGSEFIVMLPICSKRNGAKQAVEQCCSA